MHSLNVKGVIFSFNSDLSGDVHITNTGTLPPTEVEVPCAALLKFVAEHVRRKRIIEIECMSTEEVLGIGSYGEAAEEESLRV